jgi:hypothetical protein
MDSSKSCAPSHPNLVVGYLDGTPKVRKSVKLAGVTPPVDIRVHNSNIDALERAVKERVFYVKDSAGNFVRPPKPRSTKFFSDRLAAFTTLLEDHLPSTAPITQSAFVDSYRGRKHVVYQNAVKSLYEQDFELKDAEIKCFIKAEKMNTTSKPDPVPRVIQPRSPRFNVLLGCFLRPIEERIYGAIARVYGEKTVMKGLNALESGKLLATKWGKFNRPVAIGLDASRFDQHVSVAALRWEHSVYLRCFEGADRAELAKLLELQCYNQCSGYVPDGFVKYETDGCRMSGDMNTGLGNCLLMTAMIHAYCSSRQIETFELANNGDDCVVIIEETDLARFSKGLTDWFLQMGFNMVVESPVYELEEVVFCQTQPIRYDSGIYDYIMVRDPRVAIAKDCYSITPLNEKEFLGWLGCNGVGGLALTGCIPVWQDFYALLSRSSRGIISKVDTQSWGVRMMKSGMKRGYGTVKPLTRASFYVAFGIPPDAQRVIESHYQQMSILTYDNKSIPDCCRLLPL